MKKFSSKAFALIAIALAVGGSGLFAAPLIHLTMGTAGVSGTNYPTGIAICGIWNAKIPGIKAVAIATGGSPHNIDLLRTKDADIAQVRSLEAWRATNGSPDLPQASATPCC